MMTELIDTIRVENTLGECVIWDDVTQCVLWTDIEQCTLYQMQLSSKNVTTFETPERLCAFGLTDEKHVLVAAFETGFARYEYLSGQVDWIARPPELAQGMGMRMNDGRVDRQGRFWCGAMVADAQQAGDNKASLYCLNSHNEMSVHESGIDISNGLCWSPSGARMYFADSPSHIIYTYDFDRRAGAITNRKEHITTPPNASPDGAITDDQGCLWSAHWGAGQVVCYEPDGAVKQVIEIPACQPTCVALGGPDRNLLFVTTARVELSEDILAQEPQAGNLFIYQLTSCGLPEPRYQWRLPAVNTMT